VQWPSSGSWLSISFSLSSRFWHLALNLLFLGHPGDVLIVHWIAVLAAIGFQEGE